MEPEKRKATRKRMDQLLYAELGPDNGSIVLNLSENGCSFQAIAPVRNEELQFTFAIGGGQEVQGTGRVVWVEPSKKMGGLEFVSLSPELRDQIHAWLSGEKAVSVDAEPARAADAAPESEAKLRRKKLREEARRQWEEAQRIRQAKVLEAPSRTSRVMVPSEEVRTPDSKRMLEVQPFQKFEEPLHDVSGLWRGVAAIVVGAVLASMLVIYHREAGHALMWLGSVIAGDGEESKGEPTRDGGKTSSPTPQIPTVRTASSAGADFTAPNAGANADAGLATAAALPDHSVLGPLGSEKKDAFGTVYSSEDVQTLWSQVEGGDTRAEVVLAEHYARGDGVIKSCGQAKVLLEAAFKKGNLDAKRKLDEISQAACP